MGSQKGIRKDVQRDARYTEWATQHLHISPIQFPLLGPSGTQQPAPAAPVTSTASFGVSGLVGNLFGSATPSLVALMAGTLSTGQQTTGSVSTGAAVSSFVVETQASGQKRDSKGEPLKPKATYTFKTYLQCRQLLALEASSTSEDMDVSVASSEPNGFEVSTRHLPTEKIKGNKDKSIKMIKRLTLVPGLVLYCKPLEPYWPLPDAALDPAVHKLPARITQGNLHGYNGKMVWGYLRIFKTVWLQHRMIPTPNLECFTTLKEWDEFALCFYMDPVHQLHSYCTSECQTDTYSRLLIDFLRNGMDYIIYDTPSSTLHTIAEVFAETYATSKDLSTTAAASTKTSSSVLLQWCQQLQFLTHQAQLLPTLI